MDCLYINKKHIKKRYILLIIMLLLIVLSVTWSLFEVKGIKPKPEDKDWNPAKRDNPANEFDSLYHLTEVPQLKNLLYNSTFIKHLTVNRNPYLYGFSQDSRYAAFIYYTTSTDHGYLIQVYDFMVGKIAFSILLPNTDQIVETREFLLAKEALEVDFNINVPPIKLSWEEVNEYHLGEGIWNFKIESENEYSYLQITKEDTGEEWSILANNKEKMDKQQIEIFGFPGHPEFITFMINKGVFSKSGTITYTPIFLNLNNMLTKNSNKGSYDEADRWLYGDFHFIYNQWNTGVPRGFIASSSNPHSKGDRVQWVKQADQWIYLDPTGTMKWYGNSRGIFNIDTITIDKPEINYTYRLYLNYSSYRNTLEYFTIDVYNKNSNTLIKTIEFKWDEEKKDFVPIQNIS